MSARRRRGGGHEGAHENDERWLLTYSDMITLLMALFIVMWSISMVNTTKFDQLKVSLHEAFTHQKVLDGSPSVLDTQSASQVQQTPNLTILPPSDPAVSVQKQFTKIASRANALDTQSLRRIQAALQKYAATHGLSGELRTSIDERGLVIRILTDKLLFDSGQAVLQPQALPLIRRIAQAIDHSTIVNPVRVEGNTDNVPIHTPEFRSNWELSTARATAVLEVLHADGVANSRLSVAGYGSEQPVASNTTPLGRSLNRRVDIVVLRNSTAGGSS